MHAFKLKMQYCLNILLLFLGHFSKIFFFFSETT